MWTVEVNVLGFRYALVMSRPGSRRTYPVRLHQLWRPGVAA